MTRKKIQGTEIEAVKKADVSVVCDVARPGSKAQPQRRCVVCGDEVAPFSKQNLCWVCRRLKVSAWRDAEGVNASQE
jgi:ribosomal protein S14